jgi:hypothetical protein
MAERQPRSGCWQRHAIVDTGRYEVQQKRAEVYAEKKLSAEFGPERMLPFPLRDSTQN